MFSSGQIVGARVKYSRLQFVIFSMKKFLPAVVSFVALLLVGLYFLLTFWLGAPSPVAAQGLGKSLPSVGAQNSAEKEAAAKFKIPVLEYHHINTPAGRWTRTPTEFRNDLLWLYNNNYAALSVEDFVDGKFNAVPAGKKPVVISFDDGLKDQLYYLPMGNVAPDSAVGILDAFVTDHPDFGRAAVFYLNAVPFYEKDLVGKKIAYLVSTGRQLGFHTLSHTNLTRLGEAEVKKVLLDQMRELQGVLPNGVRFDTIAYPFGGVPKRAMKVLSGGEGAGLKYGLKAGFLVGAEPAEVADLNSNLVAGGGIETDGRWYIPRIQAIDSEWLRHFNRKAGEVAKMPDGVKENFEVYVSDGSHYGAGHSAALMSVASAQAQVLAETGAPVVNSLTVNQQNSDQSLLQLSGAAAQSSAAVQASAATQMLIAPQALAGIPAYAQGSSQIAAQGSIQTSVQPSQTQLPPVSRQLTSQEQEAAAAMLHFADKFQQRSFRNGVYRYVRKFAPVSKKPTNINMHPKYQGSTDALRGIYFTAYTAGSEHGRDLVRKLKESGGNMVVFDMKEIDGHLFYPSEVSLNKEAGGNDKILLKDPRAFVDFLHENGVYVVARIVCFKDELMAVKKPEWAIQSARGGLWKSPEGQVWLDPSLPAVQDYVISVAREAAAVGVDEVQFDYVRFPTQGPVGDANYSFDEKTTEHWQIIQGFLKRADAALRDVDVKIGVDVFGIVVWNNEYDAGSTGQKMAELAPYIDTVYPMIYPSHFGPGFAGYKKPGDAPYFFIGESVKLFKEILPPAAGVQIRPWLQAFAYRVSNYGPAYVAEQVRAVHDQGLKSFVLWNAGNNFDAGWGSLGG